MKWKIPFLVLILGVIVIGISGCASISNSTKHFDNGVVSFDYPSNMEVVDYGIGGISIVDGSTTMVRIIITNYTASNAKYSIINDNNLKSLNQTGLKVTKETINGKTAYDCIQQSGNRTTYYTYIDIDNGQAQIIPSQYLDNRNQKDTSFYKTYQVVVNSFHSK
ncbi:MAG: hypothetical protein WCF28_07105 [Methanobacterium sp.]|uniref:hypothetical protein n=1 Tax=Methanobacterium sp. TaxID=2164 RepID=UPI003C7876CE